ncbi:putative magnesium ion transporter [Dioszegia hungarica]|uniref:Magnesium transporter n=1 Tax=Dioszegia hungarica TaxID=4972 RepID=A0AA38LXV0_9TREE|nr:putative magnesium ion transporter [Dioszegia hungarica]KAI9637861.1 putative magnesium ion transporter [Dioszegia hungarica]
MSRPRSIRCLPRKVSSHAPTCPAYLPPTFLLPSVPPSTRRSLFTRRSTSFWAQSYPDNQASTSQIPYAPPSPTPRGASASPPPEEGRKKEKKQRYLDSLMDKAGELNLRCSVLDAEGNWTAQEGRYKKAELCKEYDLDPRDLRKLDSLSPNLVPLILTRRTCILISILHVRALIKPDRVVVFDTAGTIESELQKRFKWHLERNIKAGLKLGNGEEEGEHGEEIGMAYEHRALESILVATANALEEEMAFTRSLVQQLLEDLDGDINRDNLKRLLYYSRKMVGFQSRARYVKRAVDEILDNDEDLSEMYLTSTALGRPRASHDHVKLELLLESFTQQVEEIVSEIDTTVANMQSTQEIAELMLDSGRNALMTLDIKISIATLGIGTGALLAGVFGMNLTSSLESTPYAFYIATGSAGTIALLIWIYGYRVLRRVRRVALSDKSSSRRHIVWEDAISRLPQTDPLTGDRRAERRLLRGRGQGREVGCSRRDWAQGSRGAR